MFADVSSEFDLALLETKVYNIIITDVPSGNVIYFKISLYFKIRSFIPWKCKFI